MAKRIIPTAEDLERGYVTDGPDRISVFNLPVPIEDVIADWEAIVAGKQVDPESVSITSETEALQNTARLLGRMTVGFGVGGVLVGATAVSSIEHGVPFDAGVAPMIVGGFVVLTASVAVWCREHL